LLYLFEDYALDCDRRELHRGANLIPLQPQVFDLLEHLIRHRDHVVGKDDLNAAIWGGRFVSDSALTARINAARTAIGDSGEKQRLIRTLPRKGVRFIGAVEEQYESAERTAADVPSPGSSPGSATLFSNKASIAVLPFDNLSGDAEQEYFADGMVEEIITGLAKTSWLAVVSRNSGFIYKGKAVDVKQVGRELGVRYVLDGSVRRSAGQVRITGQLINAISGVHLWADRFDGSLEDVFELQDRVAASVVCAIEPAMRSAEIQHAQRKPTSSLDAYDWFLRALSRFNLPYPSRYEEALVLCRKAIAADPHYAAPYALAAWGCAGNYFQGPLAKAEATREEGLTLARKALDLAGSDPIALSMGGHALSFLSSKERDRALEAARRALALAPNSAHVWLSCGHVHQIRAEGNAAIEHFERALHLSPRDPFAWSIKTGMALGHFIEGRWREAADWAGNALQDNPTFYLPLRIRIAAFAHLGQIEEARAALQTALEVYPETSISKWEKILRPVQAPAIESYIEGFRKAGMPE
jgi:TolB-like protein